MCPEKRSKKKTRRRKNKSKVRGNGSIGGGDALSHQHHHRQHHIPEQLQPVEDLEEVPEDDFFVDDDMFGDMTNVKPIERIDVDPVHNFDVFLPVRKDHLEPIHTVINVDRKTYNSNPTESFNNREEFDEMERDLENELHRNRLPDNVQERTAHHNIAGQNSGGSSRQIINRTYYSYFNYIVVFCLLLVYQCKYMV